MAMPSVFAHFLQMLNVLGCRGAVRPYRPFAVAIKIRSSSSGNIDYGSFNVIRLPSSGNGDE